MKVQTAIILFTSIGFFYYGLTCLISPRIFKEFERFGLTNKQRIITGIFQLLGSLGLLIGLMIPFLGIISSVGLLLLMILGFGTRLKVRDNFWLSFPSFFFMMVNAYITYIFYQAII